MVFVTFHTPIMNIEMSNSSCSSTFDKSHSQKQIPNTRNIMRSSSTTWTLSKITVAVPKALIGAPQLPQYQLHHNFKKLAKIPQETSSKSSSTQLTEDNYSPSRKLVPQKMCIQVPQTLKTDLDNNLPRKLKTSVSMQNVNTSQKHHVPPSSPKFNAQLEDVLEESSSGVPAPLPKIRANRFSNQIDLIRVDKKRLLEEAKEIGQKYSELAFDREVTERQKKLAADFGKLRGQARPTSGEFEI